MADHVTPSVERHRGYPLITIVTMQIGMALTVLLSLMLFSGALFYLYTFNYDIGPYFTAVRFIHFYAGLASIPFLLAKYGVTGLRFAGYYLRLPRFKAIGPPPLLQRLTSPLLALDFFVLYFSGLYMLFHYYYTVTNISPFEFKPVQLHLWSAILAVPLLAVHLSAHLLEAIHGLSHQRATLISRMDGGGAPRQGFLTRRALLASIALGGVGLAGAFQNTRLANAEWNNLFIGRIPEEERGGPGDFPVETLFGKTEIDAATWQLQVDGTVEQPLTLTYADLLTLPAATHRIRLNCVSGWTARATWSGPRVRDVLDRAGADPNVKSIRFQSTSGYAVTWHADRLRGDDALLATHVNGAPLSLNHGFPVRLIVPGYPGQSMVKQLDRITVIVDRPRFDPDLELVRRRPGPSGGSAEVWHT